MTTIIQTHSGNGDNIKGSKTVVTSYSGKNINIESLSNSHIDDNYTSVKVSSNSEDDTLQVKEINKVISVKEIVINNKRINDYKVLRSAIADAFEILNDNEVVCRLHINYDTSELNSITTSKSSCMVKHSPKNEWDSYIVSIIKSNYFQLDLLFQNEVVEIIRVKSVYD